MADNVVIMCMRIEDLGYAMPDSTSVACSICKAACMISPASRQAFLADYHDWPHLIWCNHCGPAKAAEDADKGEVEVMQPSPAMWEEIKAGAAALDELENE